MPIVKASKTARYALFVHEYIKDFNATQAYMRAFPGTPYKKASFHGHKLTCKNIECMAMIEKQARGRIRLSEITAERVTMELARIGFSDPRKMMKATMRDDGVITEQPMMLHEMDEDTARAIKEVESDPFKGTKLKLHSKENALGLLAKITGAIKPMQGRLTTVSGRASTLQPDDMLDEEIEAALIELESGDDSDDSLIDMDDDGNAMLDEGDDDEE